MSMPEHIESALNGITSKFSSNHGPITTLNRLSGGASQEIWVFELTIGQAIKRFILRRAPGGERSASTSHTISLENEAKLLRAVGATKLPVPKVAYICSPEDGLGSGYIMEFIAGETFARRIQRDDTYQKARAQFSKECGAALATIHQTPLNTLPDLPVSSALVQIQHYEEIYRQLGIPRPTFELALQMLKARPPEEMDPVLVHGDFRLGNLMIGEDGLRAVLDWELAHLGDPREDIGWICVNSWRFGAPQNRVGGIGQLEDLLSAYSEAGGRAIRPKDIYWWEMLGGLKWGIMCMIMYDTYRSGADVSVERVAIGRRISETEIDLINLMEGF